MSTAQDSETPGNKRAPGKTMATISIRQELLNKAKSEAEKEGKNLSEWLEQVLVKNLPASEQ